MNSVRESFLENQLAEAAAALDGSELIRIGAVGGPEIVIAEFACRGLVRAPGGPVVEADRFAVAVRFPAEYQRHVNPLEILALVVPNDIWHPNMGGPRHPTGICVGPIVPGTPLLDLLYRVHELITWQSYTPVEYDSLNPEACAWARANAHRLPVDPRPLRWRADTGALPDHAASTAERHLLDAMEVVE